MGGKSKRLLFICSAQNVDFGAGKMKLDLDRPFVHRTRIIVSTFLFCHRYGDVFLSLFRYTFFLRVVDE